MGAKQFTGRRFYEFDAAELYALIEVCGESNQDSTAATLSDEMERELIFRCREGDEQALDVVYNGAYPIDTRSLESDL